MKREKSKKGLNKTTIYKKIMTWGQEKPRLGHSRVPICKTPCFSPPPIHASANSTDPGVLSPRAETTGVPKFLNENHPWSCAWEMKCQRPGVQDCEESGHLGSPGLPLACLINQLPWSSMRLASGSWVWFLYNTHFPLVFISFVFFKQLFRYFWTFGFFF